MTLLLIAIALMVLIAWVALRAAELDPPRDRAPITRAETRAPRSTVTVQPMAIPARGADVVVGEPIRSEAVTVQSPPVPIPEHGEMGLQPAMLGDRPVLVRIGVPHPQPDPDRMIQTEILLPDDGRARTLACMRLIVSVLGFGVTFGVGIVLFARWLGALLS